MEDLVSLCKRRGFIFQSSEIYGGLQGVYDYGPLGVELKNNGGLSSYVSHLRGRKQALSEIFECSATQEDVGVEISMQWTDTCLLYTSPSPRD